MKKPQRQKPERSTPIRSFFGFPLDKDWLSEAELAKKWSFPQDEFCGEVFFLGKNSSFKDFMAGAGAEFFAWQKQIADENKSEVMMFSGANGPRWLIRPELNSAESGSHDGLIDDSAYSKARDLLGSLVDRWRDIKLGKVAVHFVDALPEEKLGGTVGIGIAAYRYKLVRGEEESGLPQLVLIGVNDQTVLEARQIAHSVNLARHLVNLPACDLNPKSYSEIVRKIFTGSKHTEVDVWDFEKLKQEKMGLIVAVGKAAADLPVMVHLRYRPAKKAKGKPLAFVGKGITFDSGGLDLKPADGMRLMKKDMGGSAALVGLALWLERSECSKACDIYLALAENAVAGNAYRPGDIVKARNGLAVEIHNTDAEGRLVLADAMDVAINQKGEDEPDTIIDVATLTGAIKVALGSELFGLFANDDQLSYDLLDAAVKFGERGWRMPLFRDYRNHLNTPVADLANASNNRFGGAISAALFLQRFVGEKKWAHLDIYGWADRPVGSYGEIGATGQGVQCLIGFLRGGK